ncbi:MAG TPA: GAF domain-containing SpoIIE family protein phosphatase, partial [Solirubrobacteraceae bacterium]|nr:GAF domain-containing SpoIIE family protein phosphatase [Solirubrobacteraceae bacterium]
LQAREREREARRRVERLHRLSAALAAAVGTREMAAAAVAALADDLEADDVAVALVDSQTAHLAVAARHRADAQGGGGLTADTRLALEEIMRAGRVVLWSADSPHGAVASCPVPWDAGVHALAVLPLSARGAPSGVLLLTFAEPRAFDEEQLAFMEACAAQCSQALERARLYDYQRTIAHALQQSMLAGEPPRDARFDVASCYLPSVSSLDVGGDWHDTFRAGDGRIGVVVGDVVGRGIEAATAMGQLRSAARALGGAGFGPAEVLERLDRFVDQLPRGRLATVAYAELDLETGRLRYSSAGHPPPLLLQPGEPPRLLWDGRSTPLGTRLGPRSEAVGEVDLQPCARVVLYTDGLIERRAESLDEMLEALAHEAAARRDRPLGTLLSELVGTLAGDGERVDDVCVLCLEYVGGGAAATA